MCFYLFLQTTQDIIPCSSHLKFVQQSTILVFLKAFHVLVKFVDGYWIASGVQQALTASAWIKKRKRENYTFVDYTWLIMKTLSLSRRGSSSYSTKSHGYYLKRTHFRGNLFFFLGFSPNPRKLEPVKYFFFGIFLETLKILRKMKEICPQKGETTKISVCEMQFFGFFSNAKTSSL